jgi:hypothetical protein
MIKYLNLIMILFLFSCNLGRAFQPRKVDWQKEWQKNGNNLKALTQEILSGKNNLYKIGNNEFPNNFKYPFDEGFYIEYRNRENIIDTTSISIRYYIDRGLLEHFSGFIFTKDLTEIQILDSQVRRNENDFKLEPNWYIIND